METTSLLLLLLLLLLVVVVVVAGEATSRVALRSSNEPPEKPPTAKLCQWDGAAQGALAGSGLAGVLIWVGQGLIGACACGVREKIGLD